MRKKFLFPDVMIYCTAGMWLFSKKRRGMEIYMLASDLMYLKGRKTVL